jgi:hypothetical protein
MRDPIVAPLHQVSSRTCNTARLRLRQAVAPDWSSRWCARWCDLSRCELVPCRDRPLKTEHVFGTIRTR